MPFIDEFAAEQAAALRFNGAAWSRANGNVPELTAEDLLASPYEVQAAAFYMKQRSYRHGMQTPSPPYDLRTWRWLFLNTIMETVPPEWRGDDWWDREFAPHRDALVAEIRWRANNGARLGPIQVP